MQDHRFAEDIGQRFAWKPFGPIARWDDAVAWWQPVFVVLIGHDRIETQLGVVSSDVII